MIPIATIAAQTDMIIDLNKCDAPETGTVEMASGMFCTIGLVPVFRQRLGSLHLLRVRLK